MDIRHAEKTIVIVPAYNEGKKIFNVVSQVLSKYPEFDVLVINDGSVDDTSKKALEAGAILTSHAFNMGYGTAIQTGYKYALMKEYQYLVQIDGDGQHNSNDIVKLLDPIKKGDFDITIGSRYLGAGNYRNTVYRYAGTILFRYLLRIFTGNIYTDPTSGFQAMSKKVIEILSKDFFPVDYPDADVIVILHKLGIKIKEIPVKMFKNNDNRSMHKNPLKVAYYMFKMILSITLTAFRKY